MKFSAKILVIMLICTFIWGCSTQPKVSSNKASPANDDFSTGLPYTETGSICRDQHLMLLRVGLPVLLT